MTDFTYKAPPENAYFKALIEYLSYKKEDELIKLLSGSRCKILDTSQFSRKRWNGMWTEVVFEVSLEKLGTVTEKMKKDLVEYCSFVMPEDAGLDVMSVEFKPLICEEQDLVLELNKTTSVISQDTANKILGYELIKKGKAMSEVYIYLYCVENSLRLFIEKELRANLGDDYLKNISEGIKRKVTDRKNNEEKNKWLSLRGSSDLFYMDFKELGSVIRSNWGVFSYFFPNQEWITSKIDDLSEVRNLVAHNSYVGDQEAKLMKSYYEIILKQIESKF